MGKMVHCRLGVIDDDDDDDDDDKSVYELITTVYYDVAELRNLALVSSAS